MLTPDADIHDPHASARRPRFIGWLLMAPMLLWLLLFVAVPTALLIVYSFCTQGELGQVQPRLDLSNYPRVFQPTYLRVLWESTLYAGVTTVVCVLAGYPVAYFIARAPTRWRNRLLMLVMIPFWTSFLIRTYAWFTILKQDGLLNKVLMLLSVLSEPMAILYTPKAMVIGLVYVYLPFMILPIYASAEKLDGSLIEAALDLYAGPVRAFVRVILPLTLPGVVAGITLVFVPAIGMFAVTDLMGGKATYLIGNVIQEQFVGQALDRPFGSALGVTLLAMFALVLLIRLPRRAAART